jgi:hypothetical protein
MDFSRLALSERERFVFSLLDLLAIPPLGNEKVAFQTIATVCKEWATLAYRRFPYPPAFLYPLLQAPPSITDVTFNLNEFLQRNNHAWWSDVFDACSPMIPFLWFELRKYNSWFEWKHEFVVAGFRWAGDEYAIIFDRAWDAPAGWQQYLPIGGSRGGKPAGNEVTLLRGVDAKPLPFGKSISGVRTVCRVQNERGPPEILRFFLDHVSLLATETPRYCITGINCWAWSRYLFYFVVMEHLHGVIRIDGREISREAFLRDPVGTPWIDRIRYGQVLPSFAFTLLQSFISFISLILPPPYAGTISAWFTRYCVHQVIHDLKLRFPRRGRTDLAGLHVSSTSVYMLSEKGQTEVSGLPPYLAAVDEPRHAVEQMADQRFVDEWDSILPSSLCVPGYDPTLTPSASTILYDRLSEPGQLCYILYPVSTRLKQFSIDVLNAGEVVTEFSSAALADSVIFLRMAIIRSQISAAHPDGVEVLYPEVILSSGLVSKGSVIKPAIHKFSLSSDSPLVAKALPGDYLCLWVGAGGDAVHSIYSAIIGVPS